MTKFLVLLGVIAIACMCFGGDAVAAKKKKGWKRPYTTHGYQGGVATQPSNNPFADPIGLGVPPAVSTDPRRNTGRTNAPRR